VEYRTRPTRIIGERFYIYASKAKAAMPIWSDDLRVPALSNCESSSDPKKPRRHCIA
jgi:hypothetical protein